MQRTKGRWNTSRVSSGPVTPKVHAFLVWSPKHSTEDSLAWQGPPDEPHSLRLWICFPHWGLLPRERKAKTYQAWTNTGPKGFFLIVPYMNDDMQTHPKERPGPLTVRLWPISPIKLVTPPPELRTLCLWRGESIKAPLASPFLARAAKSLLGNPEA